MLGTETNEQANNKSDEQLATTIERATNKPTKDLYEYIKEKWEIEIDITFIKGRGTKPDQKWGKSKRQNISLSKKYLLTKFHKDRTRATIGTV